MKTNFNALISSIDNTFTTYEEIDFTKLEHMALDKELGLFNAEIRILDNRMITRLQQSKIYALLGDICIHQEGFRSRMLIEDYRFKIEQVLYRFGFINNIENFSLSNCSVLEANNYIEVLLKFMFDRGISIEYETAQLLKDEWIYLFHCLKERNCCVASPEICSGAVERHHATHLVGMGNKRSKHDHWNSTYMALCKFHHTEVDAMGLDKFCNKYHVKPIKLTKEQCEELKL